eukprot:gnl/Spiro4/21933_TR10763_c0_g13_i1.p1 gnl/Spiro4/21933_TR10763_c0_g13~~gnl/Spiro4/21933_TR10763_c0_g13_i1.p1  ORF type:complete len:994 (-),score=297.87 gnl/Spiro4/21933_TR10763_c0_g13_i1:90-3035(-)
MSKLTLLVSLLILCCSAALANPLPSPVDLAVDHMPCPALGVGSQKPLFSWKHGTAHNIARGLVQTHYQIVVSTTGDSNSSTVMWDSGRLSSRHASVRYAGTELKADTSYYLRVRAWMSDATGAVTPTGESASCRFHVGLLRDSDWNASWISSLGLNRAPDFALDPTKSVSQATAYVTGLGYVELYVNNIRVGRERLSPAWTTYTMRVLYSTYDVTNLLAGRQNNTLGVWVGSGWFNSSYNSPAIGVGSLMARVAISVQYTDGSSATVVASDATWFTTVGPIVSSDVYNGEVYDARKETPYWLHVGYNVSDALHEDDTPVTWVPCVVLPAPYANSGQVPGLVPQQMPPIMETGTLLPVNFYPHPSEADTLIFDFGQNHAGWVRLAVQGPAGAVITIRHAEVLMHPPYGPADGTPYYDNLRGAKATDVYTLKGFGVEIWEPRFTYHGFRYAAISGLPNQQQPDVVSVVVGSALPSVGSFSCDNQVINQIQQLIVWGQRSNLMSVPTDCDQRDERKGWMGDSALSVSEAMFNFGGQSFFANWLEDIRDAQLNPLDSHTAGSVPDTVPHTFGSYPADPAWGTAYPTVALHMLLHYNDTDVVGDHYPNLQAWIGFLQSQYNTTGFAKFYSNYGDWVPPPVTWGSGGFGPMPPSSLISSYSFLNDLRSMEKIANMLGKQSDAAAYHQLLEDLRGPFNQAFYVAPQSGKPATYGNPNGDGLQSSVACALDLGVVDDQTIPATLLSDLALNRGGNWSSTGLHLATGIVGTKCMFPALSGLGYTATGVTILQDTTYPSFGFMATNPLEPATTVWELWDSPYEGPGMNSRNHIMFGSVGSWFYEVLAGITPLEAGFSTVRIHPRGLVAGLGAVDATVATPHGTVSVSGSVKTQKSVRRAASSSQVLTVQVEVPVNVRAVVALPKPSGAASGTSPIVYEGQGSERSLVFKAGKFVPGVAGIVSGIHVDKAGEFGAVEFEVGSGLYHFEISSA